MTESVAVSPPPSVYEQDAVCDPMPSEAYCPVTTLKVAGDEEFPSSASVTSHVADGTEPWSYDAPAATPLTETTGAVFEGGATFTVNVAGARLKVPPVSFDVWARLIVAEPAACGVTVSVGVAPQLAKVTVEGLTVATDVSLEDTDTTSVVEPVRLQPCLPSSFRGWTYSCVLPATPPWFNGMTSATASMDVSRLFEMSSA